MPAIEVAGLQLAFLDEVLAVAGIDLTSKRARSTAFLGPNGPARRRRCAC